MKSQPDRNKANLLDRAIDAVDLEQVSVASQKNSCKTAKATDNWRRSMR